jgi:hypothetical protein
VSLKRYLCQSRTTATGITTTNVAIFFFIVGPWGAGCSVVVVAGVKAVDVANGFGWLWLWFHLPELDSFDRSSLPPFSWLFILFALILIIGHTSAARAVGMGVRRERAGDKYDGWGVDARGCLVAMEGEAAMVMAMDRPWWWGVAASVCVNSRSQKIVSVRCQCSQNAHKICERHTENCRKQFTKCYWKILDFRVNSYHSRWEGLIMLWHDKSKTHSPHWQWRLYSTLLGSMQYVNILLFTYIFTLRIDSEGYTQHY